MYELKRRIYFTMEAIAEKKLLIVQNPTQFHLFDLTILRRELQKLIRMINNN
jgi:hypothetical protein